MEKRVIFPVIMFTLAAASFLFGIWQYFQVSSLQASAQQRMAYIITTIEKSPVDRSQKQDLYANIMTGLPKTPGIFSLDVSGSFASSPDGDSCANDGQRTVCRAMKAEATASTLYAPVCGTCNPL